MAHRPLAQLHRRGGQGGGGQGAGEREADEQGAGADHGGAPHDFSWAVVDSIWSAAVTTLEFIS